MILWLALFVLVVLISLILAFVSMRDYQEIPQKSSLEYGLFLIRHPFLVNSQFLESIHASLAEGLIISLERLFKGKKHTLVIFGPKKILQSYQDLSLLELEDYTKEVTAKDISAWEADFKKVKEEAEKEDSPFKNFPNLEDEDQFWWQVTLQARKGQGVDGIFQTQIRAVVYCQDPQRRKELTQALQNLASPQLVKIPQPFSSETILGFYQLRSMESKTHLLLNSERLMKLLTVV